MSNKEIGWTITKEALLISLIGILTGVAFTIILRLILENTMNLQVELSFPLIATTLIVGLLGGAAGALYPALRAARLDAVEALSYE